MVEPTQIEGVAITKEGRPREVYDVARDFVRQQAEGEWGDELEERDARRLAAVMRAYVLAVVRAPTP